MLFWPSTFGLPEPLSPKDGMAPHPPPIESRSAPGELTLVLRGNLDRATVAGLWGKALGLVEGQQQSGVLRVDCRAVTFCDSAGIALLVKLRRLQKAKGGSFVLDGLAAHLHELLALYHEDEMPEPPVEEKPHGLAPAEVGRASWLVWDASRALVAFTGELAVEFLAVARRPALLRWPDTFTAAEKAGVNALPIVILISFLVGLIMAFQGAIPMRQFGAEIYVANLIGLSVIRELGPLMTAIILAGRTGSAFAAELGTMRVNEEIDALATMGLPPVRFLVLPRVLGAVMVTPFLVVFADLVGVLGGSIVLLAMKYPFITYLQQVQSAVDYADLLGGLGKSVVFGLLVAGVGCFHGLRTKTGASAVGDAATRAVVSSIILITVADGIFSVLFYYLGI